MALAESLRAPSLIIAILFTALGCKTTGKGQALAINESPASATGPDLCLAVRGNGELIWGHFGGIARILETEGLIKGIAGGSSASISSFLYESIMTNPELRRGCTAGDCTDAEVGQRAAFLIKSIYYWLQISGSTDEGAALAHVWTLKNRLGDFDVSQLSAENIELVKTGLRSLYELLASATVRELVNKEFLSFVFDEALLKDGTKNGIANLRFRASEAKKSIQQFGTFDASSPAIFVRPGIIDFRAVGRLIGNIGDFYAGYAPGTRRLWQPLFQECTKIALEKQPWEFDGSECKARFDSLVAAYMNSRSAISLHRVDEAIGRHLPVAVTTATLVHGLDRFEFTKADYYGQRPMVLNLTADDFRFGYAGPSPWFAQISAGVKGMVDLRSQKYLYLGEMAWGDMLAISPAEPGLSNAQPFKAASDYVSFGGWSDLSPVNILAAGQCQKIIYLTRQGPDSKFAQAIAGQLGFSKLLDALFSTEDSASSLSIALKRADLVYCTNWDAQEGFSLPAIQKLMQNTYSESRMWRQDRADAPVGCH